MIDKREITPRILAEMTVLLFRRISIRAVLEERCPYNRLSAKDIVRIMRDDDYYTRTRTNDECEAIANSVISFVSKRASWQSGCRDEDDLRLNVLDLLILTVQDLLVMNQNRMEIRYHHIDAWRLLVRHLGEELPLAAAYARWDYEHQRPVREHYDAFDWAYVTPHNNKHLNAMVSRGVSEHHSHLWASTPYFHVSWVNLMNNLSESQYRENLKKLNPEPWTAELEMLRQRGFARSDDDRSSKKYYWEIAQARAAWIRLYLCQRIRGWAHPVKWFYDLDNIRRYENWRILLMSRNRLQSELDAYGYLTENAGDYALAIAALKNPTFALDYHILIGERWLYYRMFREYFRSGNQRQLSFDDYNLFFVYFMIRLRVRQRMVHNNDYMGFDNFQNIENRKAYFVKERESEHQLTRLTINDTLRKPYVEELEVRISPSVDQLRRVETAVCTESGQDPVARFLARRDLTANGTSPVRRDLTANGTSPVRKKEDLRIRYYYVFHFLKKRDTSRGLDASYERSQRTGQICRHDQQRRIYLQQAKRIILFREECPQLARRVLGIDAASRELDCRPEVFGRVYRMLGDHQCCYGGYTEERQRLPALGKTFHVGEEFTDVVNGLRAVDEAINFLNLDCGDRLGHALVLGVNVEEWYEQKREGVFVSIQDRMDDLAWLYHALIHFSIPNVAPLKERIKREFDYWFNIVYHESLGSGFVKKLLEPAEDDWKNHKPEGDKYSCAYPGRIDIMSYYRAWTLRGDDPSCYVDGYFRKPRGSSAMKPEEKAKVCENYPPTYEDRYISEYSLLNYLYQFDDRVRRKGQRQIKVEVTQEYVRAVREVQIKMRYRVAQSGISIETNPTSNVLIGSFRKYEKHPILAFNNRGLPVSDREEEECAQLHISVNTDDCGVFYTDLETEYALLAHSVEQLQDEEGRPRFKKNDIYTWLDHIRVMGRDQTFQHWDDPKR